MIVPNDFPLTYYENILKIVTRNIKSNPPAFKNFLGSWNALKFRFFALAEQDQIFSDSIRTFGDAPHIEERIKQDNALFSFFSSGMSLFDTFSFGIHSFTFTLNPDFEIIDERRINFNSVSKWFELYFRYEDVTLYLANLCKSQEYQDFKMIRNILIHRHHPGRVISLTSKPQPSPPATWAVGDITSTLNEDYTKHWREWLSGELEELLIKTDNFTRKHFP